MSPTNHIRSCRPHCFTTTQQAQGDPEFVIENLLALVLIGLAALAVGNILLKLIIVACSLVSAAVRYTAIGIFLAVCVTGFQPGRWWF